MLTPWSFGTVSADQPVYAIVGFCFGGIRSEREDPGDIEAVIVIKLRRPAERLSHRHLRLRES